MNNSFEKSRGLLLCVNCITFLAVVEHSRKQISRMIYSYTFLPLFLFWVGEKLPSILKVYFFSFNYKRLVRKMFFDYYREWYLIPPLLWKVYLQYNSSQNSWCIYKPPPKTEQASKTEAVCLSKYLQWAMLMQSYAMSLSLCYWFLIVLIILP